MKRDPLAARWEHIAAVNFVAPAELLAPHLPVGLELARFEDQHLLTLMAFRFCETRMRGLPVPFFGDFTEIFLSFVAEREVNGAPRRGWVFIRKVVPKRSVALVGRLLYNEDYIKRSMRHRVHVDPSGRSPSIVRYEWENGGLNTLEVRSQAGALRVPVPGSVDDFVTDLWGGFASTRRGRAIEFSATHPRWRVWPACEGTLRGDLAATFGAGLGAILCGKPHSALIAEGSAVSLGKAEPIPQLRRAA